MSESYDRIECYGCGIDVSLRAASHIEEPIDRDDGTGYDMVPVPLCPTCAVQRHGHNCPDCGELHKFQEDALTCCPPRADNGMPMGPPCRECGDRMDPGAAGVDAHGVESVSWATCEDCGLGWGPFTGFVDLEEGAA